MCSTIQPSVFFFHLLCFRFDDLDSFHDVLVYRSITTVSLNIADIAPFSTSIVLDYTRAIRLANLVKHSTWALCHSSAINGWSSSTFRTACSGRGPPHIIVVHPITFLLRSDRDCGSRTRNGANLWWIQRRELAEFQSRQLQCWRSRH